MSRTSVVLVWLVAWVGAQAGLTSVAGAQTGAPAPILPASAGPAAPAAAAPRTVWSSLGLSPANLQTCRERLGASQIGKLLSSMLLPLGTITGGLIPTGRPPGANTVAALAAKAAQTGGPAGAAGAQASAAAIKADVAGAAPKIAAIEYLATVDCHYWPEAEAALIGRLRGDRIECVRFAAAQALGSGCCCTKKTIEALQLVVAGEDKDGFPSETSERVRAAALAALSNCMSRLDSNATAPEPPVPPEPATPQPPEPASGGSALMNAPRVTQRPKGALAYYDTIAQHRSVGQVKADAKRTLALAQSQSVGKRTLTTGNRSLFVALGRAYSPPTRPDRAGQVLDLEHEDVSVPRPETITNRPDGRAPADPDAPADGSLTRTSDADEGSVRPLRSVLGLIRRSLKTPSEAGQDQPDRSRP